MIRKPTPIKSYMISGYETRRNETRMDGWMITKKAFKYLCWIPDQPIDRPNCIQLVAMNSNMCPASQPARREGSDDIARDLKREWERETNLIFVYLLSNRALLTRSCWWHLAPAYSTSYHPLALPCLASSCQSPRPLIATDWAEGQFA